MNIIKQLTYSDDSVSTTTINEDTDPIGHVCERGMGGEPKHGYVELHPHSNATIQVDVDQKERTIKISGFWKGLKQEAVNVITLNF